MSAKTTIEWTDRTWNPVRGCSRVSPGCDHCYAEGVAARFSGPQRCARCAGSGGQGDNGLCPECSGTGEKSGAFEGIAKMVHGRPHWTGKIAMVEDALTEPLHWRKPCRVFVNSMSDLFHEGVPDSFIDAVFMTMARCPQHTFQILTKRAARMEKYVNRTIDKGVTWREGLTRWPLPNVWLGVSVEDQARADERIPALLRTPAAVRFISAEPLLGAVDLRAWFDADKGDEYLPVPQICPPGTPSAIYRHVPGCEGCDYGCRPNNFKHPEVPIDWVIVGGESGRGARPMHPDWARSLRGQCTAAGVPFFFKQWGEWSPSVNSVGAIAGEQNPALKQRRIVRWEGGAWVDGYHGLSLSNMAHVGKKRAGRVLDGREWNEFPGVSP